MDLVYHKNLVTPCFPADTAVFGKVETKHLDEDNDTRTLERLMTDPNERSLASKPLNNVVGKANQIREDGEQVEHSSESSSQELTDFTAEREQIQWVSADLNDLTPITNIILEDSIFTSLESIERITESSHIPFPNSPDGKQQQQQQNLGLTLFDLSPTSPASPLSLNSCDFEVQIQADNGHTSQIQHTAESFQMDLMENLELLDSEEYLQKIDQMDMAAVWDINNEEDLSSFQDNLTFLNTSHTDFATDKQETCGEGDICEGLQQIATLLENSVKYMNVENDLRSNITYSPAHAGSSGLHSQAKQSRATMDCYVNQPDISTTLNKEDQNSTRGTWTVFEQGKVSSHVLQDLRHDLLDQTQPKHWEQRLCHYNHALSEVKDHYYTMTDEEKKISESGSIQNPNVAHSNPGNLISSLTEYCYGFDGPLEANNNCIGNSSSFSNNGPNQSFPCFEGVAQSFPAPHENPHPHPVSTPPLNDDWLFSNIATEVEFYHMVKSHEHTYW